MRGLFIQRCIVCALVLCAAFSSPANGASVVITPSKDNTLYESASGILSNGQGDFLFAGQTGPSDGINIRRGLIAFDLAAAIPANSLITGVTLTMLVSKVAGAGFGSQVTLSRLTGDWGEAASRAPAPEGAGGTALPGDATWLHQFFSNDPWTTPGGDFLVQPSATSTIGSAGQTVQWSSPGLVNDAQSWLNQPNNNFGWIIRGNEAAANSAVQFASRTNFVVSARPALTVQYEPIPEPTSAALALTALVLVTAKRRRNRAFLAVDLRG